MNRVQRIEKTFEDFRVLRERKRTARLERMQEFVVEFSRVGERYCPWPRTDGQPSLKERLTKMVRCVREFEDLTSRLRRDRPADFSIFSTLGVRDSELVHSRLLAWLFDPCGDHNEGELFLSAFAELIGLRATSDALCASEVKTEVIHNESRIDIMVHTLGDFLVVVENKVWSREGDAQTAREFRDMRSLGNAIGVRSNRQFAIFLTPSGRKPVSAEQSCWISISYRDIADQFREILQDIQDAKVQLFVRDWLNTVDEWS